MFYNETGEAIENSRAIFPLITLNKKGVGIKCLGTGFFINPMGWFITARHVLVDNSNNLHEDIMGTQTLEDGSFVNRFIDQLCMDDKTDIAIGVLRPHGYDTQAKPARIEGAPFLRLSFQKLNIDDEICAYGYPKTTKTVNDNMESFHFNGMWSDGKITEFYPNGVGLLKSMCLQTSMKIDDGASGGPVFKDDYVIGVNSTGYQLEEGEIPISFITPVHHLLTYQLELESQVIDVRKLIALNHINAIQ